MVYFKLRLRAWTPLMFGALFVAIGLAFVGRELAGKEGSAVGGAVGFFPAGFCIGAQLDASWRYYYAKWTSGPTFDEDASRIHTEENARARRFVPADAMSVMLPLIGGFVAAGLLLVSAWP